MNPEYQARTVGAAPFGDTKRRIFVKLPAQHLAEGSEAAFAELFQLLWHFAMRPSRPKDI